METLSININLIGAAIAEDREWEVARILRDIADDIENWDGLDNIVALNLRDINGNKVGTIEIKES
jgi:hypothetical protein